MPKQTMFSGLESTFGAEFVQGIEEHAKSYLLDMLLPDGTRFGDAMPVDLAPYADKSMDEIVALLADPDEDETDFIEDGSTPTPDPDFIEDDEPDTKAA